MDNEEFSVMSYASILLGIRKDRLEILHYMEKAYQAQQSQKREDRLDILHDIEKAYQAQQSQKDDDRPSGPPDFDKMKIVS